MCLGQRTVWIRQYGCGAQAWGQEGTALVVSERLLNCPPQLAPPLHQALFEEEIPWATQDEPSAEARDAFRFRRFLLASRVYADFSPGPASGSTQAGMPKAKRKRARRRPHTCCAACSEPPGAAARCLDSSLLWLHCPQYC